MARVGMVVGFIGLLALGFSLFGLVNRRRSVACQVAGTLLAAIAGIGTIYTWIEIGSPVWIVIYFSLACIGGVSAARQSWLGKQNRLEDERAAR